MSILPPTKILCAFDFSPPSRTALQYAGEMAAEFGAELCVLHVMEALNPILGLMTKAEFDASRSADAALEIRRAVEQTVEKYVNTRPIIKSGDPASEILHTAHEEAPNLIVMATRGRTGLHRVAAGSVAKVVARLAPVPVLTVHLPPPGEDGSDAETPMAIERKLLVEKYDALATEESAEASHSPDNISSPRDVHESVFHAISKIGIQPTPHHPVSQVLTLQERCSGANKDTASCKKCRNCRHTHTAQDVAVSQGKLH